MQKLCAGYKRKKEIYDMTEKYISSFEVQPIHNAPLKEINEPVIWMFWNDAGWMPKIVKRCMESVKRHASCRIIMLTDKTVGDYVAIPGHIMEKYNKGIISQTHFSDILRVSLLSVYGGTWMDATVYLTAPIPSKYTDCDLCLVRGDTWGLDQCHRLTNMCSNWYISSKPENKFIEAVKNALYGYWYLEEELKDYFFFHIMLAKLLDSNINFREQWDAMPFLSSQDAHYLNANLSRTFSEEKWEDIKKVAFMHKLSYKARVGNFESFFHKIMRNEIS